MSNRNPLPAPAAAAQEGLWVGDKGIAKGIFGSDDIRAVGRWRRLLYESPADDKPPIITLPGIGRCMRSASWDAWVAEREQRAKEEARAAPPKPPQPRRGRPPGSGRRKAVASTTSGRSQQTASEPGPDQDGRDQWHRPKARGTKRRDVVEEAHARYLTE